MDLEKSIEAINKNRAEVEASFVFCLWKNPDLYSDYKFVNEKEDNIIKSEDAVFYFNLGRAYQSIGEKALSAEYFQMTLDLNKITQEMSEKEIRQRLYDLFE